MLIRDKIETIHLTDAEQAVARLILSKGAAIESMTARDIASEAGTVPSLISRFSRKLGYDGWNTFRREWVKESSYLMKTNQKIDANLPFAPVDGINEVSSKLSSLMEQSIQETHSLLDFGNLQKAADFLCRSSCIYCLGVSSNAWLLESFASKMRKIGKPVQTVTTQGEFQFSLSTLRPGDCILAVSYSGSTPVILDALETIPGYLSVPVILLTSMGANPLRAYADAVLEISTREKLYSKVGPFTTETSVSYLLSLLYSCVFQNNPSRNYEFKVTLSRSIETRRKSDVTIISEDEE